MEVLVSLIPLLNAMLDAPASNVPTGGQALLASDEHPGRGRSQRLQQHPPHLRQCLLRVGCPVSLAVHSVQLHASLMHPAPTAAPEVGRAGSQAASRTRASRLFTSGYLSDRPWTETDVTRSAKCLFGWAMLLSFPAEVCRGFGVVLVLKFCEGMWAEQFD